MSKRDALLGCLVAGMIATAMPAAKAAVDIGITVAPPAPQVEVVPAPRPHYVWAPGYWRYAGGHHAWVAGHWIHERAGSHWVADTWETRDGRYHYVRGHWAHD
jgi:hypothetical protein